MQVHQLASPTPSVTQCQPTQHRQNFSSPPPSMLSPGNFFPGTEGGRLSSHSPNQLNTHACSHNQCSASFPTLEMLEKHEIINHSSGGTSVVCTIYTYKVFKIIFPYTRIQ
jgi:hypothetical protein